MPNPILQMLSGDFNPRSPCGERPWVSVLYSEAGVFQSTLPVRGATAWGRLRKRAIVRFQSTLPVRGATTAVRDTPTIPAFQSTLPVRGATGAAGVRCTEQAAFQSTLPVRGATLYSRVSLPRLIFQSTLPVRGATVPAICYLSRARNFNPRSPCGERPGAACLCCKRTIQFQSTLPVRGATV